MEFSQLRTFQTIAATLSFTKAAEELHLTQPAVTLQIKNLEEELGELLVDRLGRSIALTPAGEVFLTYAQQVLNLCEQAHETVRQYSRERGRLTVGAGTTTTIFRLPGILERFHHHYPGIEIRIRNGDSELISRLVFENAVDLGLVTTIDPALRNLIAEPVFRDRIWLIGPRHYPESIQQPDLAAEPLILFRSGAGFRQYLQKEFQKYDFTPRVSMELESMEAMIRFVAAGLGMAFLPEVAVAEEIQMNKLRKIKVVGWGEMTRQTYLVYRHDKYQTWPIRAFMDQLRPTAPR